jgi:protein-S-isoprenylcysteine O-methyltransferase Ste14
MLFRAIFAFLALPGIVAFVIPLVLAGAMGSFPVQRSAGFVVLILGVFLLVWCVREFYVTGRGTLAPWQPPQCLVVTGPYRYCRNPMYVGVGLILLGWAILYWSGLLLLYAASIAVAFHLRVVLAEEPRAARTFGEAWSAYRAQTPRWPHWKGVP